MLRTLKNRANKLEARNLPKAGQLPIVVSDETSSGELMRLRNQNPGRTVVRFSDSVDLFV